jgi:hypothetical protein
MDDYKEYLGRLAVHDGTLVEAIVVAGSSFAASVIGERTAAPVRVAATIVIDAAVAEGVGAR